MKLVGDAVMFVAVSAGAACDVALTLLERFADDPAVTPRGGLAEGRLLARGGDYYGPAANLASRIGELAVPREILVTAEGRECAVRVLMTPGGGCNGVWRRGPIEPLEGGGAVSIPCIACVAWRSSRTAPRPRCP